MEKGARVDIYTSEVHAYKAWTTQEICLLDVNGDKKARTLYKSVRTTH
jgi:hypothetical protein